MNVDDMVRQVVVIDDNSLALVADSASGSTLLILHRESPTEDYTEKERLTGLQRILRLFSHRREILCEMADGSVNDVESIFNNIELFQSPEPKTAITYPIVDATSIGDEVFLFLLSDISGLSLD